MVSSDLLPSSRGPDGKAQAPGSVAPEVPMGYAPHIRSGNWRDSGRAPDLSGQHPLRSLPAGGSAIPPSRGCIYCGDRGTRGSDAPFPSAGVWRTKYLITGPVYPEVLGRSGIDWVIPEAEARERMDAIIFCELVRGSFLDAPRRYFQGVIRCLGERGCDVVVLGGTDIPLLVGPTGSPLSALDSTRLLARAALEEVLREPAGGAGR